MKLFDIHKYLQWGDDYVCKHCNRTLNIYDITKAREGKETALVTWFIQSPCKEHNSRVKNITDLLEEI